MRILHNFTLTVALLAGCADGSPGELESAVAVADAGESSLASDDEDGGVPANGTCDGSGECGDWQWKGFLDTVRRNHSAIALDSERILVVGGYRGSDDDEWNQLHLPTEIFDVKSGKSSPGPRLNHGRISSDLFRLDNGDVLAFGSAPSVERYDGDTWSIDAEFPFDVVVGAFRVADDRWLVTGDRGQFAFWEPGETPTVISPLPEEPMYALVFPGRPGEVLIISWTDLGDGEPPFELERNAWRWSEGELEAHSGVDSVFEDYPVHQVHRLSDGKIFIFGSMDVDNPMPQTYAYDPTTDQFSRGPDATLFNRRVFDVSDGRVFLSGPDLWLEPETMSVTPAQPVGPGPKVSVGCAFYSVGGVPDDGRVTYLSDVAACR